MKEIYSGSRFMGTVEESTPLTDSFGESLFVGDVVECLSTYRAEFEYDWE
jgi:hypothetical protein